MQHVIPELTKKKVWQVEKVKSRQSQRKTKKVSHAYRHAVEAELFRHNHRRSDSPKGQTKNQTTKKGQT